MLLTEVFLTEERHYNWTAPIVLYRGSQRGEANPFADTKLGFPTFSDVPGIADGYTFGLGKMFSYKTKLNKPCILWEGEHSEVVIEPSTLQERLRFSDDEMVAIVQSGRWYCDDLEAYGADIPREHILRTLQDNESAITINAYTVASMPLIQRRAIAAGYDGFILRGPYTGMGDFEVTANNSWDGITALEWMIFKPSCVELIREVSPK